MTRTQTLQRALQAVAAAGENSSDAERILAVLDRAGFSLADANDDELVCRWVDVLTCPVPPEADTIIRTITRTVNGTSSSTTHWLDGLHGPRLPA